MNRLAQSQSLYLRKHAENPIDWWPWCEEALTTAKQQNLPIFLSIGYSSCHWCTVMEREAFSDSSVAAFMNARFLPIKVDREERPDLDSFYMRALQLMTGAKGWPLNLFLSPDEQIPFYAGTYFPLQAKYGKPGFLDVLQQIRQVYDADAGKVIAIKAEIHQRLQQTVQSSSTQTVSVELLNRGLIASVEALISTGQGACFPMIPFAEAALRATRFNLPDYNATGICQQRGLDLALGGIFDHVGGGFHRYTVDFTWTVPHFEKMLYDNGQIVQYLADLWSVGLCEPAFEQAVQKTVAWLKREMRSPLGYFYAAQDADSFVTLDDHDPEEGRFYTWSYAELEQYLNTAELEALNAQFTVTPLGNLEGRNVLQRYQAGPLSNLLESALTKLFSVRYGAVPEELSSFPTARNHQDTKTFTWLGRIPPVTDTKMIVAWNSLMISGLARAATVFQKPEYLDLAIEAARFILEHQWFNGRLHRIGYANSTAEMTQPAVVGQSEDYALLIKALLDLEAASTLLPSCPWFIEAVRVQQEFDRYFWSAAGGYYNAEATTYSLLRERSCDDSSLPSANGVAVANLVRLFLLSEDISYLKRAEQTLSAFSSVMVDTPRRCPSLFVGLDWFSHQAIVQAGPRTISKLLSQYHPTTSLQLKYNLPDDIVGFVCQGLSCQIPAPDWKTLLAQLTQLVR